MAVIKGRKDKTTPARICFAPDIPSPLGGWGPQGGGKDFVTPQNLADFAQGLDQALNDWAQQALPDWLGSQVDGDEGIVGDLGGKADEFTAEAPIVYDPDAKIISHAAVGADTAPYKFTGKVVETLNVTPLGHLKTPVEADFVALPTKGLLKWAQATGDYAYSSSPITVSAKIENAGTAVTVIVDYAGSWGGSGASLGREFPNIHTGDIIPVYQDTAGNWRTPTGVHDAPLEALRFMAAVPASVPAGWELSTLLQGRFPVGYKAADADFGTVGASGGAKTHPHSIPGHDHEVPQHDHDMSHGHDLGEDNPNLLGNQPEDNRHVDALEDSTGLQVAVNTSSEVLTADAASHIPPFGVVYALKRIP